MENNNQPTPAVPAVEPANPFAQAPQAAPTVAPASPAQQPVVVQSSTEQGVSSGGSKKWIVIAVLVVAIVALAVGAYIYRANMQQAGVNQASKQPSQAIDNSLQEMSAEIEALMIEDVQADFTSVDQDLNSL